MSLPNSTYYDCGLPRLVKRTDAALATSNRESDFAGWFKGILDHPAQSAALTIVWGLVSSRRPRRLNKRLAYVGQLIMNFQLPRLNW
jgi:hypothetical protein